MLMLKISYLVQEIGCQHQDIQAMPLVTDLETVLGPIEVKYSWSPELPKGFTWFSIGFWF
jgi:hypothetical protein